MPSPHRLIAFDATPVNPWSVTVIITIALLFLIGYSSQRSSVCMVRAAREVIERRRVHRLAGFLLAAASAMLIMAIADRLGASPFTTIIGARIDRFAIAGGVLFGLGSWINGHCAVGTLAALTSGRLSRLATLAAMFCAAIVLGPSMSKAALMLPDRAPLVSPLVGHALLALTIGVVLAGLAATYVYRRLGWRRPRGGWSPLVAMTVIGVSSGVLFALDQHWVYTSRLAELADGEPVFTIGKMAGPAALIVGMVVASLLSGMFQLQMGEIREWLSASGGGLLMGLGATLVPGGNDAMLFTGVPLLLPNLLIAYAAFFATLFVGLRLGKSGQSRLDMD